MGNCTSNNVNVVPEPTKQDELNIVTKLRTITNNFPELKEAIEQSLSKAREKAKDEMDSLLFSKLDWPTTFDDYVAYIGKFSRWKPTEKDDADYQNQEVFDQLCHFYWLIDQKVLWKKTTKKLQNIEVFANWLVDFANDWGSFLNTPQSFSHEILDSFLAKDAFNVRDSMVIGATGKLVPNDPSGWLTWNQFFARELNPGLRPISQIGNNEVVTCPADCTFKRMYPIDEKGIIKKIKVKLTHSFSTISKLLEGSPYADDFNGGIFYHSFLGPSDYHRFHAPVGGKVLESRAVHGRVYLSVQLKQNDTTGDGKIFDAPDDAEDGYEFTQSRGIIIFDTAESDFGDVGKVAVVPIGMAQVSSVTMLARKGAILNKGDEFGYFLFGGSDIILLFEKQATPELQKKFIDSIDTESKHHNYGTQIAQFPRVV